MVAHRLVETSLPRVCDSLAAFQSVGGDAFPCGLEVAHQLTETLTYLLEVYSKDTLHDFAQGVERSPNGLDGINEH